MRNHVRRFLLLGSSLLCCVAGWPAPPAGAACNQLVLTAYKGKFGTIDSPFLLPSTPRTVTGVAPFTAGDIVSIAYRPPATPGSTATPPLSMIVLADDCSGWSETVCAGEVPELPVVLCDDVTPMVSGNLITFRVPGFAGEEGSAGKTKPVPTSKAKVYPTGPVRVLVSAAGSIPCQYALPATPCPTGPNPDVKACIESLDPKPGGLPHEEVLSVTALPGFNDFSALCDDSTGPHGCKGSAPELRFTVDANRNILIPMQWTGVLRDLQDPAADCDLADDFCEKREVTAWTTLPAKASTPSQPIDIPVAEDIALQTFNLNGETFTPRPKFEVAAGSGADEFVLTGESDKHFSVLRILGCAGGNQKCSGGRRFEVADRMQDGLGPVKVPKEKFCEKNHGVSCQNQKDCKDQDLGRCLRTGGRVGDWIPPQAEPAPAPPPPPPAAALPATEPRGPGAVVYGLAAVAALGLAWWLWSRAS